MQNEVFATPKSDLITETQDPQPKYYVVSNTKLFIMYIGTLGLYVFWWSFANWQHYKKTTQVPIWPIARAIFSIFFMHSLFREVNKSLKEKKLEHKWSPMKLATFYVIFSILSNITDRLSSNAIGSPYTDILSLLFLPAILIILLKAQKAINLSQNDSQGMSNASFSIFNILWLIVGGIIWIFALIGVLTTFGVLTFEG